MFLKEKFQLKDNYCIDISADISSEKLKKGWYFFVYRANRIPPHLGFIINAKAYDITTVGPTLGLNSTDLFNTALRRKTEVVFVKLKTNQIQQDLNDIEFDIKNAVLKYDKVTTKVSCLAPIKDVLEKVYMLDLGGYTYFFDVLNFLKQNQLIELSSQINMQDQIINNSLIMKTYTNEDIDLCIDAINRKNKVNC